MQSFLLEMAKIPRGAQRVKSWYFYLTSDDMFDAIKHTVKTLRDGIFQVHHGLRFKGILKIVFDIGTYLNEGTYNAKIGGKAVMGFDIDTLAKVTDVRGVLADGKEKTNMLRYISDLCERKFPMLVEFGKENVELDAARYGPRFSRYGSCASPMPCPMLIKV